MAGASLGEGTMQHGHAVPSIAARAVLPARWRCSEDLPHNAGARRDQRHAVVIEHDMDLVARLCHPVMVMSQGRSLMQGALEDVLGDETVLEHCCGRARGE